MEPLHEFNPCQELSPPLQQEDFASLDADGPPTAGTRKKKGLKAKDYDMRVRNAVKLVRRAALVDADTQEGECSDRTVDVGGRSLAWAVSI